MKKVYNNFIPFKGFKALTIWPFMFIRKDATISDVNMNHEKIHAAQQKEMNIVVFVLLLFAAFVGLFPLWRVICTPFVYFVLYGIEYVIRLFMYGFDKDKAYINISFEREAYANQYNFDYLSTRKAFAWFILIKQK